MTYAIQQDKLCAFQSRKLEDFIDSERQEVRLQLEPQGVLNVVITFENTLVAPLYTPVKGLRRQQGLIHIKQQQGKKLIRPADLNIDIGKPLHLQSTSSLMISAAWTRLLRGSESMRSSGLNHSKSELVAEPIQAPGAEAILNSPRPPSIADDYLFIEDKESPSFR